jgi:hypothetical protein
VWQELLHNKYLVNITLSQVEAKPMYSPFLEGLMHIKEDLKKNGICTGIRFWKHIWLEDMPLAQQ